MKKTFTTLSVIAICFFGNAQVGIDTNTPQATLDITGKPTIATVADGVIAPRLSLANLNAKSAAYTTPQTGAIVYVNDISGATGTGSTASIDATGYYYFDGTNWIKFRPAPGISSNIYTSDGTLSANRTVIQGGNTLTFTGTATNAFSVDGTTFSVDAANNRIGLGTATPTSTLDVQGDARISTMSPLNATSSPLYWNATTGALEAASTKKPFNTYRYTITLNSDWISDLNTNISTTNYTLIITAAYFRLPGGAGSTNTMVGGVAFNNKSIANVNGALSSAANAQTQLSKLTISDKNVYAYQSGGTWRINADYPDAAPVNPAGQTYEWIFDVLVINNSMVKIGMPQAGTTTGSTISIPVPSDL